MWAWSIWGLLLLAGPPGTPVLRPVSVCEVLKDPGAYDRKVVAVVGRLSLRDEGRWLGEDHCEQKPSATPGVVWLTLDQKSGPPTPEVLDIDGAAVSEKLKGMKESTPLRRFPFGSFEYDRWAVVYGRVESRPQFEPAKKNGFGARGQAPAQIVIHGDAAVLFVPGD